MAELRLNHVYKMYENTAKKKRKAASLKQDNYAVKDLSLVIPNGEFIGILGPSGCGKSTTLRMIAGLEEITKGEIQIGNQDISRLHPKDRGIGLAFEDYALYPPLSVYDNIAFCLKAHKLPKEEVRKRVLEIAGIMKVETLLEEKVSALSGGQKQRVNIARALVRNPDILLLDEPLSHLDGKMRQILRGEIKRLHKMIGCTTILVTHDQMEAMSLADRIAIMKLGVLQQYGTPEEIYNDPVNLFVADFIGEPPMNLLTVRVQRKGETPVFVLKNQETIKVPRKFYPVIKDGEEYIIGIRPTNIEIVNGETYDALLEVDVFENLGEEKIISIRIEDTFLTIVAEETEVLEKGDKIRIKMKEDRFYLFDKTTGMRIREPERR